MYAAQNRHTAVAECLVTAGANISLKDKSGRTAVEIASEVKCPEIVTLLKDQSAIASDSKVGVHV
jgi:ankyrin repeat protein